MPDDPLPVIHSFPVWLPRTQTWMHTQVQYLPDSIRPHVVCDRTVNLDQFPVRDLHCLSAEAPIRAYWEGALRHFHFRHRQGYLVTIARQAQARIVHSHFGHIGWIDSPMVTTARCRHMVTFYGSDVNRLPTQDRAWLRRYCDLFAAADAFLCEGPFMAAALQELGCPSAKVRVHHLGVETQRIPFRPRQWSAGQPLRILIASAFREKKGIPYAFLALGKIKDLVPLEITVIGDSAGDRDSDLEKRRILESISDAGLEGQTTMLGFRPYRDMLDRADQHDVFVSPSVTAADGDTEGGAPVSIIEMMASGMPVVSTIHCDIPEVVQYGQNDWLVAERDANGLADRLLWLIKNPEAWGPMLRQGRAHIEAEFNAHTQGSTLAEAYRMLMTEPN